MRVLFITERFPFGGGESFFGPELTRFLDDGHDVLIVPLYRGGPVVHRDLGRLVERTAPLPARAWSIARELVATALRHPARTARALAPLGRTRTLKQLAFNIVAAAKGAYVAHLAREWGAEHIHVHWAHYTATAGMVASTLTGVPWSLTGHRFDIVTNNLLAEKLRRARFARFISRSSLALAAARVPADALRHSVVMHLGAPPPEDAAPAAEESPSSMVLCVANLVPVKGHKYLLDAAEVLRRRGVDFQLWLAGDGELRDPLTRQIEELALGEHVRLLGHLPREAILDLYQEGRIACTVLPSVDLGGGLHEGLPMSLVEAMSFGVPVISTRTGGIPELLEEGAGLLVPPADAESLADAMLRVLADADLRERLRAAARRRIAEEFDAGTIVATLVRYFRGVAPG